MSFRVITSGPGQNTTDKSKSAGPELQPPPSAGEMVISAQSRALDVGSVDQLLDRLESLSFTFEALNASSRTYAAEAVLETLARMERRDLQALAAIEAFASALKTVSHHLAGLRSAVQNTAHDTAAGFEHIGNRLDRLEQRAGFAQPAGTETNPGVLNSIAERLNHIETMIEEGTGIGEAADLAPLTEQLETIARRASRIESKVEASAKTTDMAPLNEHLKTIARRVSRVEGKVDGLPDTVAAKSIDLAPVNDQLASIARKVSRVEGQVSALPDAIGEVRSDLLPLTDKLDNITDHVAAVEDKVDALPTAITVPSVDLAPVNEALQTIARRVSRIERRVEAIPAPQVVEPVDLKPLHELLTLISGRLSAVENRADLAGDLAALGPFLEAVDSRLYNMEAGLGLAMSDIEDEPDLPPVAPVSQVVAPEQRAEIVVAEPKVPQPQPAPPAQSAQPSPTVAAQTPAPAAESPAPETAAAVPPQPETTALPDTADMVDPVSSDALTAVTGDPEPQPQASAAQPEAPMPLAPAAPPTAAQPEPAAQTQVQTRQRVDQLLEQVFRVLSR